MITYIRATVKQNKLGPMRVNPYEIIRKELVFGTTSDGLEELTDFDLLMLASDNEEFAEFMRSIGIEVTNAHAEEFSNGSRRVSSELVTSIRSRAGVLSIKEINLLHCISDTAAEISGIIRLPENVAGFLSSYMYNENRVSVTIEKLSAFCSKLNTNKTRVNKIRQPGEFNFSKYRRDTINDKLDNVYLDAMNYNSKGYKEVVLEIQYTPISEYIHDKIEVDGPIINGYVYYTRRGEVLYYICNNEVLATSISADVNKEGCVEVFERGIAKKIIPPPEFDSHGLYRSVQKATQSIGDQSKFTSLNEKIEMLTKKNTDLEFKLETSKNKLLEAQRKILEEKAKKDSEVMKTVNNVVDTAKNVILGTVAIIGGVYTIKSYISE